MSIPQQFKDWAAKRTHCYVATLRCGCGVAIVVDDEEHPKDTAKDVSDFIKSGYSVQRLPHKEATDVFRHECAEYPHTDWQLRLEQAKKDKQK